MIIMIVYHLCSNKQLQCKAATTTKFYEVELLYPLPKLSINLLHLAIDCTISKLAKVN